MPKSLKVGLVILGAGILGIIVLQIPGVEIGSCFSGSWGASIAVIAMLYTALTFSAGIIVTAVGGVIWAVQQRTKKTTITLDLR
jgi:hypothetical protein